MTTCNLDYNILWCILFWTTAHPPRKKKRRQISLVSSHSSSELPVMPLKAVVKRHSEEVIRAVVTKVDSETKEMSVVEQIESMEFGHQIFFITKC